jgi:hypothetical protein
VKRTGTIIIVVLGVLYAIGHQSSTTTSTSGGTSTAAAKEPAKPEEPTCKTDWKLCADNADMANNYRKWFDVKWACKAAATDMAKYGTPEWPSWGMYFGYFRPGHGYKETGKVVAIEPKAKFQNGFGAMVHTEVRCEYDLNTKKVTNVTFSGN